jgi:hypothetical protein
VLAAEPCHTDRARPGPDDILVYFACDELPAAARPVVRPAGGGETADRLRQALVGVFVGPTASEAADGYEGPITPGRSEVVGSVAIVDDGAAVIDFDERLIEGTALNASSARFIFFDIVGRTISRFRRSIRSSIGWKAAAMPSRRTSRVRAASSVIVTAFSATGR